MPRILISDKLSDRGLAVLEAAPEIDFDHRPGLDPETSGYQPTEADLSEFEKHLRTLLEG